MKKLLALLAAGFLTLPVAVQAMSVSGSLNFTPSYDYDLVNFTVNTAGGSNFFLDGDTDAYLFLFSGTNTFTSGTYITEDDDSGGSLDSSLFTNLVAGNYTAYITTHGTSWDGSAFQYNHDHSPMNWTLTVDGDTSVAGVPDAGSSLLLLGMALGGLTLFKRSRA